MTDHTKDCQKIQPLLREYAVGLLSEGEARNVAAHLDVCEDCRAAFQAEQAALALLDSLPEEEPPVGLAERTIRNVEVVAAEKERRKQSFWSSGRFAEVMVVVLVMGVLAAVLLPALARSREAARRSSCQNNLKQWGLVFKMYANESPGEKFPPAVCVDGIWTVDLRAITPEYLTDPSILVCPQGGGPTEEFHQAWEQEPPDWDKLQKMAAEQYVYLPWVIPDEETFMELIKNPCLPGVPLDADVEFDGYLGFPPKAYRLREGVERFLITDINNPGAAAMAQASIPIAFDNPGSMHHIPDGINVLYLDGHVEFMRLGSGFPATQAVWNYFMERTAILKKELGHESVESMNKQ
jgi:prepilin-type processing-associated H-X9-DG protein